jgi:hypothetical protein
MSTANNATVIAEIRRALENEESRLGEVWRGNERGLTQTEIAEELGVETSNFVWNNLRFARAIEFGDLPTAPSVIRSCLSAIKGFVKRNQPNFSERTTDVLLARICELESRLDNSETVELEDHTVRARESQAEALGVPGIYVYTLPHYYRNPLQPADGEFNAGKTLMKVGMSENDVITRFRTQQRDIVLPEDPWLLRIYGVTSDIRATEKSFHDFLRAADHRQQGGRSVGKEWFLTSLRFLDQIAKDKSLEVLFRIEDGALEN